MREWRRPYDAELGSASLYMAGDGLSRGWQRHGASREERRQSGGREGVVFLINISRDFF
jgi:hypothetical protein